MKINTNISSLQAQRRLAEQTKALGDQLRRLASGTRITRAGDDTAGLAISSGLEGSLRALRQGVRNLNDAESLLQTVEGSMSSLVEIVQRMRELAVQAANGTMGSEERNYLDKELQSLAEEYDRIVTQTDFNGQNILDGSLEDKFVQLGANRGEGIVMSFDSLERTRIIGLSGAELRGATGTGTFTQATTVSVGDLPTFSPVLVDLNNDGNLDILAPNRSGSSVSIRLGQGDGSFIAGQTLTVGSSPGTPVLADINGDQQLDLLVANPGSNNISVRLGNGDGSFSTGTTLSVGNLPDSSPVLADLNGDGALDIVVANESGNTVSVRLGNGDGTFVSAATVAVGNLPSSSPVIADINGDGDLDMLVANYFSDNVSVRLGNGDGTFSVGTTVSIGSIPAGDLILQDLNGDGALDFLIADLFPGSVTIRLGQGDGTFIVGTTVNVGSVPAGSPILADLNGDNILDMVVNNYGSHNVSVRLGVGDGTFAETATIDVGTNPESSPKVIDVNGDDILDIVVSNTNSNNVSIRLGVGDGTFNVAATLTVGGKPAASPALGDLDGDGVLDLVVANSDTDNLSIFLQGMNDQEEVPAQELSIRNQTQAQDLLEVFDEALLRLSARRAKVGALGSRVASARNNLSLNTENIAAAKSQILDADVALASSELLKLQVLRQATVAVLSQANIQIQAVLSLLPS